MTTNPNIVRIPSLTGDPADDAYGVGAGTGTKITAPIGDVTKQGVIDSGVKASDLDGATAEALTAEITRAKAAEALVPFINATAHGAKGDGTSDDTAAIQAALDAAGNTPVWLEPGKQYLITAPLTLSTGNKLISSGRQMYFPPSVNAPATMSGPVLIAGAGWSGTGMIEILDKALTGDTYQPIDAVVQGVSLYGANLAQAGVYFEGGGVLDAIIQDVNVFGTLAYGFQLKGHPSGNPVQNVHLVNCTGYQVGAGSAYGGHSFFFNGASNGGCYDCQIDGCVSVLCNGAAFYVDSHCASLHFRDCRAEQGSYNATSGGEGYLVNSVDKITFARCSTDNHPGHGFSITNALNPAAQGVVLSNCVTRRDGSHDDTANAGVYVSDAGPVIITGHANDMTQHGDSGLFSYGPAYGLITAASARVSVTGGWFKGLLGGWKDDGTTTKFSANVVKETYPQTTLSTALTTAAAATITVASTTGFASSGSIQIGSEVITYTGTTATTFTGCTRGAASTTVAAHAAGAIVAGPTSPSTVTNA